MLPSLQLLKLNKWRGRGSMRMPKCLWIGPAQAQGNVRHFKSWSFKCQSVIAHLSFDKLRLCTRICPPWDDYSRSEIAWREAKYAQIFEYLREEYEVAQRFGNLDFKLKFVEHNVHFLQEVLQNRKSDLLEWCIIVLLSIENVISISEIVRAVPT